MEVPRRNRIEAPPAPVEESMNLTKVNNEVFHDCKGFKTLTIPEGGRIIESYAFRCSEGLKGTLDLPSMLREIGALAFDGGSGLNGYVNMALENPPAIDRDLEPFDFDCDKDLRRTLRVTASSLESYRKAPGYADLYDLADDYLYREGS
jgi:hypothetical protein